MSVTIYVHYDALPLHATEETPNDLLLRGDGGESLVLLLLLLLPWYQSGISMHLSTTAISGIMNNLSMIPGQKMLT